MSESICDFFSVMTPVGYLLWQLREEADLHVSHSRGVLWLAGASG